MIMDLHVHTDLSDDGGAGAEDYLKAITAFREVHEFDGIVFTEHRRIDQHIDYRKLAEKYDILVLKGVELDTNLGHLLVYGVDDYLLKHYDLSSRNIKAKELIREVYYEGGIAVPAHPFRESFFGKRLEEEGGSFEGLHVIEGLNGQNTQAQNQRSRELAHKFGFKSTGASDAHFVNRKWFLTCATQFDSRIENMEQFIQQLYAGNYRPIELNHIHTSVIPG